MGRHFKSKLLFVISAILTISIIVVIIIIFKRSGDNIPIQFYIPGSLNNLGCLSVRIDDNSNGNMYSFDGGKTWQKSKYGAVYGQTTILVKNNKNEIIYKRNVTDEGFVKEAPVIKMNFDNIIANKSEKELLSGVIATLNGNNITSSIKANILEEKGNEIVVSYLVNSNINRCYIVKSIQVKDMSDTAAYPSGTTTTDKWVWPTKTPYRISSNYGWRGKKFHSGVDITGLNRGSPIYAARAGVVTAISSNLSSGYYVIIKHDNGYYTRYAHMQNTNGNDKLGKTGSANKYIFVGLRVKAKDVIGEIGSSGNSTGLHLHFEIWDGKPFASNSYNPLKFYKK